MCYHEHGLKFALRPSQNHSIVIVLSMKELVILETAIVSSSIRQFNHVAVVWGQSKAKPSVVSQLQRNSAMRKSSFDGCKGSLVQGLV